MLVTGCNQAPFLTEHGGPFDVIRPSATTKLHSVSPRKKGGRK
jgi:hypothetical protein